MQKIIFNDRYGLTQALLRSDTDTGTNKGFKRV